MAVVSRRAAAGAVALLLLAGCGSQGRPGAASPTLTVFAAASLKGTFTELGNRFQASHPGTTVTFSFAGSADLVTQIQSGAPADVFASADTKNMARATADHLVHGTPVNFATNTLEIAVPPGNPGRVRSLQDVAKSGLKVVVCAPEVPCGSAAQQVETASGVQLRPVSEEFSVTDVLAKVSSGEADAGLVYVTDVKGAGSKVVGVPFPEAKQAVNTYPIAALAASTHQNLAQQFVDLVTGADGQRVLAAAGFAKP